MLSKKVISYCLPAITLILMFVFLLYDSDLDFSHIIPHRLLRLATIVVSSLCIAYSAIIFQTLTNNRILVPSVMGYETVYLVWQSVLVLIFGTAGVTSFGVLGGFISSIAVVSIYAFVLHKYLLPMCKGDMFVFLLFGFVFSMVLLTVSQFIQFSINPGEFSILQSMTHTSFNRANLPMLILSAIVTVIAVVMIQRLLGVLDVMTLGKEQAQSLGVNYAFYLGLFLSIISVLTAILTSLIGLTGFIGIFISNIAYALSHRSKHKNILPIASLLTVFFFISTQLLVEHVFNYQTTVNILMNLVCGIYFFVTLIIKKNYV
ncbi:iron chelate uptake ABC transporter family permease subunit [Brackiella oedipodis]|uniref:iron chelate uptake ABC transporter family permease subunit n=1 Tax=Brackiella oedipodis TaxID=124225 RepID=UPI00068756CF|nr:iron chelate uptake ABC transporter family permease subunit [Brackiella oedipodis]